MANSNPQELLMLGRIIWALVLTLLILSYLTVGLRLWVRCRITKSASWDDAAMVATLVGRLRLIIAMRVSSGPNYDRYSSRAIARSSSSLLYVRTKESYSTPTIFAFR
jgi:hypothetical protein